jgi:hypothetical protein
MSVQQKSEAKALDSTKKLSLGKRTLKDLSVRHAGPKGGFITVNTLASSPSTSAKSGTSARWY